ncbi:unnamed protein product, partial [Laminaria digitata]
MDPERSANCFSLHTNDRTVDFEVDNPWLVLLVVRALRLFLGAHYDTLPAPTFFSHLCVRPAPPPPPHPTTNTAATTGGRADIDNSNSPKQQPLVWAGGEGGGVGGGVGGGSPVVKEPTSTPTERTSGDSASDDSDEDDDDDEDEDDGEEEEGGERGGHDEDTDCGSALDDVSGGGDGSRIYRPAPDGRAPPGAATITTTLSSRSALPGDDGFEREDGLEEVSITAEAKRQPGEGDGEDEGGLDDLYGADECDRSPGGIMALFSSGKRGPEDFGFGSSSGRSGGAGGGAGGGEEGGGAGAGLGSGSGAAMPVPAVEDGPGPLTASQLLATRGMSKRLSLAKKLSAANNAGGAALKGRRFDLMALPMDPAAAGTVRDRGPSEHAE